jgi:putative hydrolase of the HAD superfamily
MTVILPPQTFETDLLGKFGHVSAWVFDLDNTLYPPDCGIWPAIEERITLFLIGLSGLDGLSAQAMQKYYYRRHGTTLRGLVEENIVRADEFLEFVHDIDRSTLAPNPPLAREVERLPGRKLIFTNGSRDHALRTLERLGLDGLFEDAFDIVAAGLIPKPADLAYEAFFKTHEVDPACAAMFEDLARNLRAPKARGMTTTLVAPRPGEADYRETLDHGGVDCGHVDFVTHDLVGFLAQINAQLAAAREAPPLAPR